MQYIIPQRMILLTLMVLTLIGLLFFGRNQAYAGSTTTPALTLGPADGFNQFILQSVTLTGSRSAGHIAYGGNVSVTNHSIGDTNPLACDPAQNVAIFGSDVNYTGGSINAGSAVYAGAVTSDTSPITCPGATFSMSAPIDFAATATELISLSTSYADQVNNSQTLGGDCFFKLQGSSTGTNVFNLKGESLVNDNPGNTCYLSIDVACGATALINVSDDNINLSDLDVIINGGTTRGQVLFNFYEATTISIDASNFEGSVLAPKADFITTGGSYIEGSLVAKSLSGDDFNTNNFPLMAPADACYDYGDLPSIYNNTNRSDDGARHEISDLFLGATVDGELDGQEDATASNDDNNALNDEDGVVADPTDWEEGTDGGSVEIVASQSGCLSAWIDWNDDRDFDDAGEKIIDNIVVAAGTNALTFDIPEGAAADVKFGRFRLTPLDASGECTATVDPTGLIIGGEVEDYRFILADPSAIALSSTSINTGVALTTTLTTLLMLAGITVRSTYKRP